MAGDQQPSAVERQPAPGERQGEPVTVVEAARIMGRSVDAVRGALHRGTLAGHKGNDGQWRVYLPPADGQGVQEPDIVALLRQELDRARADLQQAVGGLEALRRQSDARFAELAEARAELAEARTEARLLREGLERERARADRLEAALARPWWRRLIIG